MNLRELIAEIKMSPGALAKSVKSDPDTKMLVGFEFEIIVPRAKTRTTKLGNWDCTCYSDIVAFFGNYNDINTEEAIANAEKVEDLIAEEYRAWKLSVFKYIWSQHYPEDPFDPEDPEFSQILESNQVSWSVGLFFQTFYPKMADVYHNYKEYLTWPETSVEGSADLEYQLETFYKRFVADTGLSAAWSDDYHSPTIRREYDKFIIEPDSSITPDSSDYFGVEIVSPPVELDKVEDFLKFMFKWFNSIGAKTNYSTGLHLNISVEDMDVDDINYTKLVVMSGDQYVLRAFNRLGSTYCIDSLNTISKEIGNIHPRVAEGLLKDLAAGLQKISRRILDTRPNHKYNSIHVVDKGWVEFRSPGSDWLSVGVTGILAVINRYAVALKSSLDQSANKQEYAKKLYKLMPRDELSDSEGVEIFARYAAGMFTQDSLRSILKQRNELRTLLKQPPEDF